ncbi:helix-turn-helix domain-containing protein [Achromobacter aloeverae]|uniref:Transcriptional regulator n=2 Tax=Achromobacter aloeverae TaxID=1750518 RepID=A0A4Q1HR61_9BURK|nr:helix-turn-helix domain-containing protein [Achromobacter aloeverae]RXN92906.1 transcriptional regulator [Achromobacter aloeverae]
MVVPPEAHADRPDGADHVDPILAAVLQAFWDTRQEAPGKRLSLARLSKRAALPMSTLRRTLAQLEDAGLVTVAIDEDGAGSVVPAPELLGLIEDLLG